MITTKKQLKEYIYADQSRYKQRKNFLCYFLFGDESYAIRRFLKVWRKTEYYYNTRNWRNPISLLRFVLFFIIYRRMSLHYKLFLPLNVVGPGLYIPHRMGGVIINAIKVGKNFSISSGCVVGKKKHNENRPIIGDDVEMCIGSKIIGKVFVGDNAVIAPNSVVIKNVPSGDIVSGIPAKSIKKLS